MANIYVRSTDGNNADSGATWALAKATLVGADAIDAAGDTIYVSQNHAESTAASITMGFAGTIGSHTRIICGNDAAEPPTTLATGATITTTGGSPINLNQGGGGLFVYGLTFRPGNLANINASFSLIASVSPDSSVTLENCVIDMPNSSSSAFVVGSSGSSNGAESALVFKNTAISFIASGSRLEIYAQFRMIGGSVSSTAAMNYMVRSGAQGRASPLTFEGVDFSGLNAGTNLVQNAAIGNIVFKNCRLPTSWTGALVQSGTRPVAQRVSMYNCDSADTNYRLWIESYSGSIKSETTIVRTGGASNGATPLAWRIDTSANASDVAVLRTDEILVWNETIGSPVTIDCHVITDGVTLTDAEAWLEIQSLTTSGFPIAGNASDSAGVLATPANQTTSTEAWTTTGMASPIKQRLTVTVTPQEVGWISAVVRVAKPSTTVYVCPKIEVS